MKPFPQLWLTPFVKGAGEHVWVSVLRSEGEQIPIPILIDKIREMEPEAVLQYFQLLMNAAFMSLKARHDYAVDKEVSSEV